jgi:hypothetical protein
MAAQFAQPKGGPTQITLMQDEWITGGHTAGLAADANGAFHPFWVDNRTGVHQVWTAVATVHGTVVNPDASLAGLTDVSQRVAFRLSSPRFDMATHEASVDIRLEDTSATAITGPLKLHLRMLGSTRGVAKIVDAQTGQLGESAIVDYGALLSNGALAPHQTTGPQRVTIRMTRLTSLIQGDEVQSVFGQLEVRAFAGQPPTPTL